MIVDRDEEGIGELRGKGAGATRQRGAVLTWPGGFCRGLDILTPCGPSDPPIAIRWSSGGRAVSDRYPIVRSGRRRPV